MTFDSVRVVLRARPLRENEEMSNIVFKEQQVILNQRTFTFDAVYPPSSVQKDVYDYSIKPLFDCFMKGENGVIFAYGQTGAGKTYSLGTSSKSELDPSEEGILPRFTRSLFQQITDDCEVYVSFVSLNDEIHDLLVYPELVTILDIQDARQKRVYSTHDLLRLLSKRKLPKKCHRLFTVTLKQSETVSKFCFVDLAEKHKDLDLFNQSPWNQLFKSQNKLLLACISPVDTALQTLEFVDGLNKPLPKASQSLHAQIKQLKLQIEHLQNNQLAEEEIRMIRQEMEQMKSYSIQLSQELAETTSARDTLLLQLTQERPSESHPLIQQYAQQIQTLRLEVAETRSKLNSFCTEEEEDRYLRSRHSMMTSISSSRKKRPVIQRMRTSSSSLLKKKKSQHVDHLIDLLRKEYMEESTDETVLHLSHAPVMEEKTELEDKTEMEDTFSNHQFLSMASPSAGPLAEPNSFEDDELEALAVPSWSDAPKAQSVSGGSTKRKSISLDSMWDDTDSSITTSRVDSVVLGNSSESHSNRPKPSTSNTKLKRQGKNLLKMLHQIQADLLVKRELVGQLERSEDQFAQMRVNYEERLNELKEHLVEIQKQRDTALKKGHSNTTTTVTSTLNTTTARPQSVMGGLRENREAQEVRFQFEVKVKRLMVENQELKKKNQEATKAVQTARSKAESAMQRLKSEIESLKLDKKQLNRTLKTEMDKARDAAITYEREVQQLKRRLVVALDSKKKLEETTEAQNQVLKKRTEETAAASLQMRQLTNVLRKAANEGTFLNEAALDRIMELAQISKSNIRTTKQTRGRASSFASEPSI